VLEQIMKTSQFQIQDTQTVWKALGQYRDSKTDFADCLSGLINASNLCNETITFDKAAAELQTFKLLK